MLWIELVRPGFPISEAILNWQSSYSFIRTAKKIAVCLIIPFVMITFFESVIRNLIFVSLVNSCITVLNKGHEAFFKREVTKQ